jgi:hypothetical protein
MDIFHRLAFWLRKSRTVVSFRNPFLYQKQDGFEVITAVTMKSTVQYTPCNVVERYRRFGGTCWYMSEVVADRRCHNPKDINVYHSELLGFRTLSIVWYSRN